MIVTGYRQAAGVGLHQFIEGVVEIQHGLDQVLDLQHRFRYPFE